jgi:hypothetical protein
MLLRYILYDFEMVPVAPVITGITFVFTFHMSCIYITVKFSLEQAMQAQKGRRGIALLFL